jgi:hypothetical protein
MATSAALSNIAKYVFPKDMPHAFYDMNPGLGDWKKVTDDEGESYRYTVATSQGAVGSALYATAYTVAGNVQYTRFTLTRITDYAIARMNGEDYEALQSQEAAVVGAWKDRVETAYEECKRSLAIMSFRDGSGNRGRIGTSGLSGATITLLVTSTITNFYVGMSLTACATTTGTIETGSEIVAQVDRQNGTLTSTDASWATGIGTIANSDYLFRNGDAQNGGSSVVLTGLGSLLTGGSTPGTLWGANRNIDPVALAGTSKSYATYALDEAVLDLAQLVSIQSTEKKVLYANPRDKVELIKLLESKARFMRPAQGDDAKVGFENVEFSTDSGPMILKGDVNVPQYSFFITPPERVELRSVGPAPKPLKVDGQLVRARDAYDAYEMRLGSYAAMAHRFPAAGGQGTSWGQ